MVGRPAPFIVKMLNSPLVVADAALNTDATANKAKDALMVIGRMEYKILVIEYEVCKL